MLKYETNSAYFTQTEEVVQLLRIVDTVWGLNGKTVLEPSVGAGAFPLCSQRLGYQTNWVTNEMYPDQTNYIPDFTQDFLSLPPQTADIVIGNPPYSGKVKYNGLSMPICEAFIYRSFEWADRVAFIVPPVALRPRSLSNLPKGVTLKLWTTPQVNNYTVAGSGRGLPKSVRTTICLYERGNYAPIPYSEDPVPGLEWVKPGDPRATHAVCFWMNPGLGRALDGSWGQLEPFKYEYPCVITDPRIEPLFATHAIRKYWTEYSAGPSYTSMGTLNWFVRQMLTANG
jgi:hypothetical protein